MSAPDPALTIILVLCGGGVVAIWLMLENTPSLLRQTAAMIVVLAVALSATLLLIQLIAGAP